MSRIVGMLAAAAAAACWALGEEAALEARFRDPRGAGLGPSFTLDLAAAQGDEGRLLSLLSRLRELGAGGVLISAPVADEAAWRLLAKAADFCGGAGLELGVCDFWASAEEAATLPRARSLVWSFCAAGGAAPAAGADGWRPVARLALPAEGPVLPHQVIDLSQSACPAEGAWRELRVGTVAAEPAVLDPFDETAVFGHVNRALVALQSNLKASYGATLSWYQCAGYPRGAQAWPADMEALFLKRSGLGLAKHLPALAGVPVGGEAAAAQVRRLAAETVSEAWRRRFAGNVRDLVQEAGLEAGASVDGVPVCPEEAALFFRRPVLAAARGAAARERNMRAAGAARAAARRTIVGRLTLAQVARTPDAALLAYPFKHEADALLADGATRLLFEADASAWADEARCGELKSACSYARRCQLLLRHGEPVADYLVWGEALPAGLQGYSADRTCLAQLEAASVKSGALCLPSERTYGALVAAASVLLDAEAERLLRRLAAKGVPLWIADDGAAEARAPAEAATSGEKRFASRLPPSPGSGAPPDFEWTAATDGPRVRFLHRRSTQEEVYFVVNDSAAGGAVTAVFRDVGRGAAERWEPLEGEVGVLQEVRRRPDGRLEVSLYLEPHDACFVVFDR